jgi:hypothetical protein
LWVERFRFRQQLTADLARGVRVGRDATSEVQRQQRGDAELQANAANRAAGQCDLASLVSTMNRPDGF